MQLIADHLSILFRATVFRDAVAAAWALVLIMALAGCEQANVADGSVPAQAARPSTAAPIQLPLPPSSSRQPGFPEMPPPFEEGAPDGETMQAAPPPEAPMVTLTPPPGMDGAVRVAILLPLTGRDQAIGISMLRAAQIAVFDIAGDDFQLLPYDTKGTPEAAYHAARRALDDGARLILGPLFSDSVRAVAPLVGDAGVNLIAFSNNRAVLDDRIFLIGMLPGEQIARVVAHARAQGAVQFAALVPDTPYGRQAAGQLQQALADVDGILVDVQYFAGDGNDLTDAVRRLARYDERRGELLRQRKALEAQGDAVSAQMLARLKGVETIGEIGYEALFIPVGGSRLKEIAALLPFYDVDTKTVRLLGVASWRHVQGLGREPPMVGAWFAAPSGAALARLDGRYRGLYRVPPDPLASLAYDAAALAAVLARAEGGADFGRDPLSTPNGFAGSAGIFRFAASGEAQRGLAVLEIQPWGLKEVSPAPQTFEQLAN